jgi:hypothetical protein
MMDGPGVVRVEERDDPRIVEPTYAIIRLRATRPLEATTAGSRAMDERRAIKVLVR